MKFTLRQIIDSLPEKKNSTSSLWVKIVVRKVSFLFTYFFINIGCSAWDVSMLSVLVAVIGSVLLMSNYYVLTVVGMLLIELWLVLDCVDGNIARCKKESSELGSFVDALSGYYISAFLYLAVGVGAYHFSRLVEFRYTFLIMGAISSAAGILARLIHQKYTYTMLVMRDGNEKSKLSEEVEHKGSIQYLRSRVDKELGLSGLLMPFLIIASIFNLYEVFTVFYFLFQTCSLIAVTMYYAMKCR